MLAYLLEQFKIFPVVVSLVPTLFYLYSLDIPQYLSSQIVLKVQNAKLQRSSEYIFHLNLCKAYAVKQVRYFLTEMCIMNL